MLINRSNRGVTRKRESWEAKAATVESEADSGGLFQHEGFEHDDRGSSLSRGHDGTQQPAVRVRETTEPRFETCPVATVSARVLSTRSTAPTATLSEASSSSPRTASRTTVYASGQIS